MVHIGCMNNTTPWVSLFSLAICLLFTQTIAADQGNSTSHPTSAATLASSTPANIRSSSTCPTGTVNYITQSLPQQCRKTGLAIRDGSIAREGGEVLANAGNVSQPYQQSASGQGNGTLAESTISTLEAVRTGATSFVAETTLPTPAEADAETDSPLDSVNFLSFEDWKQENLAKIGQSPEHLNQQRASSGEHRRRAVNVNALESLGDEGEIDIDFSSFGSGTVPGDKQRQGSGSSSSPAAADGSSQSSNTAKPFRGKDAGITCAERFNYASSDCAATVLKTNPKCKNPTSILRESKDSYLNNDCIIENKFFIVELCEDILIDTVVLANFEYFSSTFRDFRVSVSDRYPVKNDKWKNLGVLTARPMRGLQAFPIENPLIWARYIRIELLTHYGNEVICPVSLLRVHGTTMMQEYRHQDESARGEDDLEEPVLETNLSDSAPEGKQIDAEVAAHPEQTLANPVKSIDEPIVTVNSAQSSQFSSASVSTSQTTPVTSDLASSIVLSSGAPSHQASDSALPQSPSIQNVTNNNQTAISNLTIPIIDHVQDTAAPNATASNSSVVPKAASPDNSRQKSGQSGGTDEHKVPMIATTPTSSAVSKVSSSQQPPAPSPTTQDSFYKQISKRLQMLESNSTLSVKYIEEQSRILRDAFTKTEKRQSNRTEKFLHQVNATVVGELLRIGQQYDQLFQSIVIQSEAFEERHQRDIEVIMNRLGAMNDDLTWQKRVSVAQSSLLLFIFALIVFVRSGSNTLGLELPLMQQMLNKSQTVLRLPLDSDSPMQSPGRTPSPVATRYKTKARPPTRSSDDTDHDHDHDQSSMIDGEDGPFTRTPNNPRLQFSPATPTDLGSPSRWANGTPLTNVEAMNDSDGGVDNDESEDPAEDAAGEPPETPVIIRQTQSGPATPSGSRENHDPLEWEADDMSGKLEVVLTLKGGARKMSPSSLRHVEGVGDEDSARDSGEFTLVGD